MSCSAARAPAFLARASPNPCRGAARGGGHGTGSAPGAPSGGRLRAGPRARPVCHQRWVGVTASSMPRSEAQRHSQHQPVVGLAGATCLPEALQCDHRIGSQLPAGAGSHRPVPGVAECESRVRGEHAPPVRESEAVARVDHEPAAGLELGVTPERACVARGPEPLGGAPRAAPHRGDGEGEAPARGVGGHADGPARTPILVARRLVHEECARLRLDRHRTGGVAQSRSDLDPGARLGVSAVVAKPHLGARGERRPVADFEPPLALEDEPHARDVAFGRSEVARVRTLRAHPHRIGFHVHREPARPCAVEHLSLDPDRAHAHRDVGGHGLSALLVQCQLSGPDARERPGRNLSIEVDPRVGVDPGERALHRARIIALRGVEPIGAVAAALREHDAGEGPLPLRVEPDETVGHVAVHGPAVLFGPEPSGHDPPPRGEGGASLMRPVAAAREVERASKPNVLGGDGPRIGFALGVLRPLGVPERVVVFGLWLQTRCPDEVDAGDGDVRPACTVEALRQCIHHLASDRAPEAHHPRLRHRVRVLDRPRRGGVLDARA